MTVNILQLLIRKLELYPDLKYKISDSKIFVEKPREDGFSLGLTIDDRGYNVSFDGWFKSFVNEQEALECFTFALSGKCRLKVYRKGNVDYKWTLQYKTEIDSKIEWHDDSTTGIQFYPFWKKEEVYFKQNNLKANLDNL